MADVRDGVGPYLSIYLKGGLHWQSGEIGIAMAVSSITAAICQIPAGLLVDSVRAKRLLVVISGILVGTGSLLVVCLPKLAVIVGAQATLGAASAVIPPALAALPYVHPSRRTVSSPCGESSQSRPALRIVVEVIVK